MEYIIGFLIGIASSLFASMLLSGGRVFWRNSLNVFLRKLYPSIKGRYNVVVPEDCMESPNDKTILELHQFGSRISGSLTFYHDEVIEHIAPLEGNITPSRYLTFTYEAPNANHNQYGSGLYRLENDGKNFKGYFSFICIHCEKTFSAESELKLIADQT